MTKQQPRRFLVAHQDANVRDALTAGILRIHGQAEVSSSADGADAAFRVSNTPHQVVFLSADLPKRNALHLTKWILSEKKLQHLAVVILSPIPDTEHFVEDVVAGRVQFLANPRDPASLEKVLMRALNYHFHGDNEEFNLRFLSSGEVLMKEGEKADNCYLVKKGRLKAARKVNGKEVFLGFIEIGEFVGEMAYINGEPRTADVFAEVASELIEIPYEKLDHVLFQKPAWSKALMRTLSKRLKIANQLRAGGN